jgi:DNA invertase Pin-like site-specific DNA recombinase
MTVGYARVSTVDQDPEYQIRALKERGCEKIFTDHCRSRAKHRPQLAAAFAFLRKGDQLAVWRLDRLGRNVPHLIQLVRDIEARGCQLESLREKLDTDSPGGKLVFTVFAALAQFESDVNSERTKESHKAAKANGRRWGRKSIFHDPATVRAAKALLRDPSLSRVEVARELGVATSTLRRWFPGGDPGAFPGKRNGGKPS